MSVDTELPPEQAVARELPTKVTIPPIRGEMLRLKPATPDELPILDRLHAFYNASVITGKDEQSERTLVHAWVARSVAWSQGHVPEDSGVADPQSRGTIAWSILTDTDNGDTPAVEDDVVENIDGDTPRSAAESVNPDDVSAAHKVIGMIFLIDIDAWARSARIQVILGKDYRGRGYSRDAMPRVMTYGFAPHPVGLNLHRIWVAVPETSTRSLSVYKSLGFVQSGAARDGLWDAQNNKYQDLIVMDTLVDEYDPIRSLDAFGMHLFEDNPGVREALDARDRQHEPRRHGKTASDGPSHQAVPSRQTAASDVAPIRDVDRARRGEDPHGDGSSKTRSVPDRSPAAVPAAAGATGVWPFNAAAGKPSKQAWWRNLGRNRKRDTEDE